MSHLTSRTVALATVLSLLPAAHAAAATLIDPRVVSDVTTDGRYVLFADGGVLDRQTGAKLAGVPGGAPLDLASASPVALVRVDGALQLVRYAAAGPTATPLATDDAGQSLAAASGQLVQDGRTVLLTTSEATPRILAYDVATGRTTVRLSGASLLDASEDGHVITWKRALPDAVRPAGSVAPSQPGYTEAYPATEVPRSVAGVAVGYRVDALPPRVVSRTTYVQRLGGNPAKACISRYADWSLRSPSDLRVSQDGTRSSYTLLLQSRGANSTYPSTPVTWDRAIAGGTEPVAASSLPYGYVSLVNDPVSGAYTYSEYGHNGLTFSTKSVADDGTLAELDGTFASGARPYARGEHTLFSPLVRNADGNFAQVNTYDRAGEPVGASVVPWIALPRTADPVDSPDLRPDAQWVNCAPTAGAPADYAPITLKTTGNSAGAIDVITAPGGKIAATSVSATVSWYGLPIWTRTAKTSGAINLPAIPAGIPGFKVAVKITLTDGKVLTESAALRRTR